MKTKKITVSVLRNELKSILKIVQAGNRVIIESHGKGIAEIIPIEGTQKANQLKLLEIGKRSVIGDIESPTGEKWKLNV
jgi:prevent-host-death family protein